jgi:hypothetical protein
MYLKLSCLDLLLCIQANVIIVSKVLWMRNYSDTVNEASYIKDIAKQNSKICIRNYCDYSHINFFTEVTTAILIKILCRME